MAKEHRNLEMEISIKENIKEASPMVMESTIGKMAVISKAISKTASDKATACGRKDRA